MHKRKEDKPYLWEKRTPMGRISSLKGGGSEGGDWKKPKVILEKRLKRSPYLRKIKKPREGVPWAVT